jgi:hypothetical protein
MDSHLGKQSEKDIGMTITAHEAKLQKSTILILKWITNTISKGNYILINLWAPVTITDVGIPLSISLVTGFIFGFSRR